MAHSKKTNKIDDASVQMNVDESSFTTGSVDDDLEKRKGLATGIYSKGDDTLTPAAAPETQGEQMAGGDMEHPESDDDTLQNAQNVGLQSSETYEDPQPLDIARDVDKAEKSR